MNTMIDESVFLFAMHETPNDELTCLALTDWLEENNQPARAEALRLRLHLQDTSTA